MEFDHNLYGIDKDGQVYLKYDEKINEFVDVNNHTYIAFHKWANSNITGVYTVSVMVADRINTFDGKGNLIAYCNVAYEETFHVKEYIYNIFRNRGKYGTS